VKGIIMTTRRQIVAGAAATVAAAAASEAMAAVASTGQPQLEFAFEARVAVEQPMVVGPSSLGLRREFEAPAGSKHEWLNRSIFIGLAERQAGAAIIRVFQLL
jgi:hypothetical protein